MLPGFDGLQPVVGMAFITHGGVLGKAALQYLDVGIFFGGKVAGERFRQFDFHGALPR
ncbi:hypothetical protein D3C72_2560020 [compost metagenome]